MFITSPKKILGLDISDLSLKAAQVEQSGTKKYIRTMTSCAVAEGLIQEGIIKDAQRVAKIIKKLIDKASPKFTTKYAVVSLPETKTFIKVVESFNKKDKAKDIIKQELPRHIPINPDEMQIDWQEIKSTSQSRKFLIGAVPQSITQDYIKICQMAGLEVVALEIEAQAIIRSIIPQLNKPIFYNNLMAQLIAWWQHKKNKAVFKDNSQPKIILDLGATRTSLILFDNGVIQFTNSLRHISGRDITTKIADKKRLPERDAEKAKIICGSNPKKCKGAILDIIKQGIDDIAKEIITAENFYQSHFGQDTNDIEILLCGGGANMLQLDKILQEKIKRNIKIGNPLINLKKNSVEDNKNLLSYTTAIGLALKNYV